MNMRATMAKDLGIMLRPEALSLKYNRLAARGLCNHYSDDHDQLAPPAVVSPEVQMSPLVTLRKEEAPSPLWSVTASARPSEALAEAIQGYSQAEMEESHMMVDIVRVDNDRDSILWMLPGHDFSTVRPKDTSHKERVKSTDTTDSAYSRPRVSSTVHESSGVCSIPKLSLHCGNNVYAWLHTRLIIQNLGNRFKHRLDIYLGDKNRLCNIPLCTNCLVCSIYLGVCVQRTHISHDWNYNS